MMNNRYGVFRGLVVPVGLFCLMASLSACTKDYVTGKTTFSLISEDQEIEMGREADVDIVARIKKFSSGFVNGNMYSWVGSRNCGQQ